MQQSEDSQEVRTLDPDLVWLKSRRHPRWNKQKKIARRLRRTPAAISKAFKGELPALLARINHLLENAKN